MRKYGKKKSRQVDNTGSPPGAIGDLTLMLSLEEWKGSHAKWNREESGHAASAICCYIPNHSKTWWLKQRSFILFNPRSRWQQVWFLLRLVSLACRWCHLAVTSHSLSSVHIWVRMSTFYKDTHHTGLGSPTDITYFFEDLISKYGYIPRYQGLGFKHEFLGVMCMHNHPLTEGFQGPPQPQTTLPNSFLWPLPGFVPPHYSLLIWNLQAFPDVMFRRALCNTRTSVSLYRLA